MPLPPIFCASPQRTRRPVDGSHVCEARSIFADAHVAGKNDLTSFAAGARNHPLGSDCRQGGYKRKKISLSFL